MAYSILSSFNQGLDRVINNIGLGHHMSPRTLTIMKATSFASGLIMEIGGAVLLKEYPLAPNSSQLCVLGLSLCVFGGADLAVLVAAGALGAYLNYLDTLPGAVALLPGAVLIAPVPFAPNPSRAPNHLPD